MLLAQDASDSVAPQQAQHSDLSPTVQPPEPTSQVAVLDRPQDQDSSVHPPAAQLAFGSEQIEPGSSQAAESQPDAAQTEGPQLAQAELSADLSSSQAASRQQASLACSRNCLLRCLTVLEQLGVLMSLGMLCVACMVRQRLSPAGGCRSSKLKRAGRRLWMMPGHSH